VRGKFIVFEGLDGSGKTTQLKLLSKRLEERSGEGSVFVTREPSDNPVGSLIRSALRGEISLEAGTIALLFAADRCEHLAGEIIPNLERGRAVLCDRFYLSNLAYQGRFIGGDRLLSYNEDAVSRLRSPARRRSCTRSWTSCARCARDIYPR
jgi:dTMP kinase